MKLSFVVLVLFVVSYFAIFTIQEQQTSQSQASITPPLPVIVQQAALGFFKELGAEMLFVKCAVFNGGHISSAVMASNADALSLNLDVATDLYPQFIDPYYLAQSTLPHISPEYAAITNKILARSINTSVHDTIIQFYRGFNFFYYMDQPQLAAEVFAELAVRDDAPAWFGHFAGILSARGGNLYVGLITLQSMLAVETDELVQQRYRDDIVVFQQAITVQKATQLYFDKNGVYPSELYDLTPDYMLDIPTFTNFELQWQPPVLKLDRPQK